MCRQVKAALRQIKLLDEALRAKALEQIMVSRETEPAKWVQREQRRLQRRKRLVERLLEKERRDHTRRYAFRIGTHFVNGRASSSSTCGGRLGMAPHLAGLA